MIAMAALVGCHGKNASAEAEYIVQVSLGGWHSPDYTAEHYYSYEDRSFNVPEFVTGPIDLDNIEAEKLVKSSERRQVGFRMSK